LAAPTQREDAPLFDIKRRDFTTLLGVAAILAWIPLAADAEQPNKLPRVGWLGNYPANTPILHPFEARSTAEIDKAFAGIADERVQALVIFADPLMVFHEKKLADLALQNRLPAIFGFREFADLGGLISYGASLREQYRRAAAYVDKILKGAKPGDLPIEQPTRFELVINLKTAKALGLDVPDKMLALADEVIE
jgi:ABC transporter substrate binding protein